MALFPGSDKSLQNMTYHMQILAMVSMSKFQRQQTRRVGLLATDSLSQNTAKTCSFSSSLVNAYDTRLGLNNLSLASNHRLTGIRILWGFLV